MCRKLPNELLEALPPVSMGMRVVHALCGLGCAGLILTVLALSRAPHKAEPEPEIYVAHQVTLPLDEPPPPPVSEPTPTDSGPMVGPLRLEIAAAPTSAVHIQVPDVPLLSTEALPPPARGVVAARFDLVRSVVRPIREDGDLSTRHVFDRSEVDQRPLVIHRVTPKFNYTRVSKLATPRAIVLLVVNTDGSVGEVRLMHGSTDEEFDESVIEAIREWRFSPAVRKGQKVRCWVEQALTVKLSGGTAFEVN